MQARSLALPQAEPLSSLESFKVLVLNSSYEPLRIVNWERALTLLLGGRVEVLESYTRQVRSPSKSFCIPSIVRLKQYVRPRNQGKILRFSRYHVFLRDEYRCQYCKRIFVTKQLTLDHVVPVMRGGRKTWSNIVTSCVPCNQRKGARTPQEAGFSGFKQPVEPRVGFLPDILYMRGAFPRSWRPYLNWTALHA